MIGTTRILKTFICLLLGLTMAATAVKGQRRSKPENGVSIKKELTVPGIEAIEGGAWPNIEQNMLKAFRRGAQTVAPVSPFYIIGPKDQLIISLWGKRTQTFNPTVDANGFVKLRVDGSDIRFSVNGLLFKDLKMKVISELAKLSSDIDSARPESSRTLVDVTLGEIRGINIMVLGEVKAPGQYTMNTTVASVFNALALAGGIGPKGSLREIMVRRAGGEVDRVDLYGLDLYTLLNDGRLAEEMFHLQEGNIVVVPLKRRVVTLSGEVNRPGAYEILEAETLGRLIELAGDFTAGADVAKLKLLRVKGREGSQFMNLVFDASRDFPLMDGDQIQVVVKAETRRLNVVEVKGEGIKQPGKYEYASGMTLVDLITQAEGLYEDAMSDAAVLVRTKEDYSLEFLTLDLDALLKQTGEKAFALAPLDKLIVYSRFSKQGGEKFVTIGGHVKEPGQYTLSARMTLGDLMFMAGGFTDPDYLSETWLDRADLTRVDPVTQRNTLMSVDLRTLLAGDETADLLLRSGDNVRVYGFHEMQDKRFVTIGGEVRLPGSYELTQGMTLEDLISQASGLTEMADRARIEIARFPEADESGASAARSFITALKNERAGGPPLPPGSPTLLQRNDNVFVRRRTELRDRAAVTISGEVAYPGEYVLLSRTETLSDIVARAGGFIEGASPDGSRLVRHRANGKPEALVVDLEAAMQGRHGRYDLVLLDGDQLEVPRQNWAVAVEGAVRFPKSLQFIKGKSASYYIDSVGGVTPAARKRGSVIIYPNGRVKKARGWFFSAKVKPGSTISVPGDEDAAEPVMPELPLPVVVLPTVADGVVTNVTLDARK